MRKTKLILLIVVQAVAGCMAFSQVAMEVRPAESRWRFRFDIGGTLPEEAELTEIGGPITSGDEMKLTAGVQFDVAAGYRVTPWLTLEAELGFNYNSIDSIGNWSYPNSGLYQLTMMANAVVEYPFGHIVPFAGIGGGGVFSSVNFGNNYYYDYYYYYSGPGGYGSDFVPAVQAFAGIRYQFHDQWSIGLVYRFLATAGQEWSIDWSNGAHFRFAVDSVRLQSICLVLTGSF